MKVFTTGLHSYLTQRVARALNLPPHINVGRVFVVAASKANAYAQLAAVGMEPASIRDPEFRLAWANDLGALNAAGLLDAPTVLATTIDLPRRVVVQVQPHHTVLLGELEHAEDAGKRRFVPTPAGVAGPVWTEPATVAQLVQAVVDRYQMTREDADDLLIDAINSVDGALTTLPDTRLAVQPDKVPAVLADVDAEMEQRKLRTEAEPLVVPATPEQVAEVDEQIRHALLREMRDCREQIARAGEQLAEKRFEQQCQALRARQLKMIDQAAMELGVHPSRVSQLADQALAEQARRRRFPVGTAVEVEDGGEPSKFQRATVVRRPWAGRTVVVRYDNGAVLPVDEWRVRVLSTPAARS